MHWGTFPVLAQSAEYFQEQVAKLCPDCDCIAMRPGQSLSFV